MRRSSFGELWPKPRHVTSFLVKKLEAISPGLTEQEYENDKGQVITFSQMLEIKIVNKNSYIRDELNSVQKGILNIIFIFIVTVSSFLEKWTPNFNISPLSNSEKSNAHNCRPDSEKVITCKVRQRREEE